MIPPTAARSSHLNASSQDSPSQAGREPSYLNFRYYWNYQEFLRKLYPLFLSLKKKQFKDYYLCWLIVSEVSFLSHLLYLNERGSRGLADKAAHLRLGSKGGSVEGLKQDTALGHPPITYLNTLS